ncbi:MAG: hypothetical protein H6Q69_1658 [Firmicutes bacterium]|nr:hypothetical protein [Bacillota bacterium]
MIRLLLNADDFGFTEAVTYGIIKAHVDGVLHSTTLMPNMPAAKLAAKLMKNYPDLYVGQHTNIVIGTPCSDPATIPSLVDENGNFIRSQEYRTAKRTISYEEVKKEVIAQVEKFKALTGHIPTHLEGHAVLGYKEFDRAIRDVARIYGIHSFEDISDTEKYAKIVELTKIKAPSRFYAEGVCIEYFLEDRAGILQLGNKVGHLRCHPGYIDQELMEWSSYNLPRCKEVAVLCDERLKKWIKDHNIELIGFDDLL